MLPKVNVIKKDEKDKFVITLGEFLVHDIEFDTKKAAENHIKLFYTLTNFDEQVICAMILKIIKLQNEIKNEEK